ncbi:hypothetical protein ABH935_001315 [Catenulispora sp. GAS73]|uniref:hypothetical protein n=1 Tax=Catenulispora sp. GAS73 TaxID=3156269 RepID=UPI0035121E8D
MSDQVDQVDQADHGEYGEQALRSHFAARAEDIQPSADLARRVAAIRPSSPGRRFPLRMSALAIGTVAAVGAATVVLVLSTQPASAPGHTTPVAPPASTTTPTPTPSTSSTPDLPQITGSGLGSSSVPTSRSPGAPGSSGSSGLSGPSLSSPSSPAGSGSGAGPSGSSSGGMPPDSGASSG